MTQVETTATPRMPAEAPARAWVEADAAADAAGVRIAPVASHAEIDELVALLDAIWGNPADRSALSGDMLTALEHSGNYLAMARIPSGALVGAAVGFFGRPADRSLHSHIAGVAPGVQSHGVGYALKLHQRAWALDRDATRITWTFDPLVARNAHFNIERLGATVRTYLTDFYGEMDDAINGSEPSDRVVAEWELLAPVGPRPLPAAGSTFALRDHEGEPEVSGIAGAADVLVELPESIVDLRRTDPARSLRWRLALREVLQGGLAAGLVIVGFEARRRYRLRSGGR